jgi:hypothetical protein
MIFVSFFSVFHTIPLQKNRPTLFPTPRTQSTQKHTARAHSPHTLSLSHSFVFVGGAPSSHPKKQKTQKEKTIS